MGWASIFESFWYFLSYLASNPKTAKFAQALLPEIALDDEDNEFGISSSPKPTRASSPIYDIGEYESLMSVDEAPMKISKAEDTQKPRNMKWKMRRLV